MPATFYQVGGSVRDELLGLKSKDIDYAVEAETFEGLCDVVRSKGYDIKVVKPEFHTIVTTNPQGRRVDFVLCRKDGFYSDGRRPATVEVGTIFDDLARRDFTVNAIAMQEDGTSLDPHGGEADLKIRLLKCVGRTEERFTEDGLRMLRAIRFALTKGFGLDHEIRACLLIPAFFEPRLQRVSVERVREELFKCFTHNTWDTMDLLTHYWEFGRFLFTFEGLWLKPTVEKR